MTRSLGVWMLLLSVSVFAQARTLARVVSVEGSTFTVEVLEGGVAESETLELWTKSGKKTVTMSVPESGYVYPGVTRGGVSCRGGAVAAGAILTKPGQFTSWSAAKAALAAFPPKTLARIVSIEGGTATVECLAGALSQGTFDLLTPRSITPVQVRLPAGVELALKGDRIRGVTVAGGAPEAGAFLADRGRFESSDEAAAAGPRPGTGAAPAAATTAIQENPAACVFSPAELRTALGFELGPGRGTEAPFPGGTSLSCQYLEPKGIRSVTVNRLVMTAGEPKTNAEQFRQRLAGRLEPIARDPDDAAWQVDQGDLTGVTLHYWKGNTGTEVRVRGVDVKNGAAVAAMRRNVLRLRRP